MPVGVHVTALGKHAALQLRQCTRRRVCCEFTLLAYLVKHPDEVERHDALIVSNHADGVKPRAPQKLPS